MLKVLIAKEGWYMNYELPVGSGKNKRRIDFLIKKSIGRREPWVVIEVKLADNPDATHQLEIYITSIRNEVQRHKDDSRFFWMLWDGTKSSMKKIKGVIICRDPPSRETLAEAKAESFDVWSYRFTTQHSRSGESLLGVQIMDSKGEILLES